MNMDILAVEVDGQTVAVCPALLSIIKVEGGKTVHIAPDTRGYGDWEGLRYWACLRVTVRRAHRRGDSIGGGSAGEVYSDRAAYLDTLPFADRVALLSAPR